MADSAKSEGSLVSDADESVPREILDSLLEGCQVVDRRFVYLFVNDAVVTQSRTTREQLLGRTMMETYPGIENTPMFAMLRRALDERIPLEMDNAFTFPDGGLGWFELRFIPVPRGVAIMSVDVTEKRRAEIQLSRSARALTVLSACNHTLVRAVDEQTFMDDVCRLLVERGGYRIAWIGFSGRAGDESVRPVASAGDDGGYVQNLRIESGDTEQGAGPTGRAIRTGRSALSRFITTDPTYTPWREAAIERGFASSIALPIECAGERIGALNIYASEPDAFDDAEVKLLEEMALDLSFGIATLRARIEMQHTQAALALKSERVELLARIVQNLSLAKTTGEIIEMVCTAARDLSAADGATFVVRDGDMCHYVDEDAIDTLFKGKRFPLPTCVSGLSMLHREPITIPDIYADARVPIEAYAGTFVKSLVMVPIRQQDPIGAIGCYWASHHVATADEVRVLQALADATSVALENVRALDEIRNQKARTRAIYDHLPTPTLVWERSQSGFRLTDINKSAQETAAGKLVDLVGQPPDATREVFPGIETDLEESAATDGTIRREVEVLFPGESEPRSLVLTYKRAPPRLVVLHAEDVTARRQNEEQLRVAQRLEAIGQLAGGVAHDFNNMLSVIINYARIVADTLGETNPIRDDALEILQAGERAAELTRQLLAFSRKQLLEPKVLSLNAVVNGIAGLLKRLLPEDIKIELMVDDTLGAALADPGQLEVVIINLAINARDAMPKGGVLRIATANVEIDDAHADVHSGIGPGSFVMLTVSDTGTGMSPETQAHIFEPFFTTKGPGKGTGLGLSTVYGIIKQSGGNIWVESEIGRGTSFKISFPRIAGATVEDAPKKVTVPTTGHETILIVEDEDIVRRLTERLLKSAGYHVISTTSAAEAIEIVGNAAASIDLMLTDVIMPEMSGRDLADRIREVIPGLRVIFMSGYTHDMVTTTGVLDENTRFIAKPFTVQEMTRKVREVLDED